MPEITVKDIKTFFEMDASQFMKEWKSLPESDRADLRAGIGDGSLTY